ncbi:type V toxin-antitoxin system endoribonuclease antitoxin GhoS [Serratia sp. L9]|uniref:type V toxin-antitoxin system endoribonuclease antitoxin GhoS n=1 Tax=Serratia sp. L9 TaxID=3423946 RepID=UPI003D67B4A1
MSQSSSTCFVVVFNYQEDGLADLAKLTGQMTLEGFTTSITDENHVPHELGINSFALITPLDQQDVKKLAEALGEVALGKKPGVTITTCSDYIRQLHADT